MSIRIKAQTALSLGLMNLVRVFKYRIGVKTGLNPVQKLTAQMPTGRFFSNIEELNSGIGNINTLTAFGYLN